MPIIKKDIALKVNPKIIVATKGDKVEIMTTYKGFDGNYHCVKHLNRDRPPFDVSANDLIL